MRQWVGVGISAIAVAAAVLGLQVAGAFQPLELMVLDQWFRARPPEAVDARIVIVTIDESDFNAIGRYPIPDAEFAQVLSKIRQQKPRVIGMDVYRNLPVEPGHNALIQIYQQTPNLIGVEKTLSGANMPSVDPPPILREQGQIAASDLVLDPDGKVRRNLLSLRVNSIWGKQARTVTTLGTRLALEYLKAEGVTPRSLPGGAIQLGKAYLEPLQANAGGYVRGDIGGFQLLANFRNLQRSFTSVSFSDVLNDRVAAQLMQDRIVLIGSIAESLNDRFFTPYSNTAKLTSAGVVIHADFTSQLISAALDSRPILRGVPEWIETIWCWLWLGIGVVLGTRFRAPHRTFVWMVGVAIAGVLTAYGLFLSGWWITIVAPLIGMKLIVVATRVYWLWQSLVQSHHALQDYTKTLEQKVQERTQALTEQNIELTRAKQEAEAADRAKTTFLANVNHELRTPLSIILSSSELMSYDKTLSPKQRERLSMINQSVNHLLDLINEVLELAKLEAKAETIGIQTLSLKQLLHNLLKMFEPQAIEKRIQLNLECATEVPNWIQTDERKLRQVLINLLTNSLKFTNHGSITLRISCLNPKLLRFEVSDTGIGIAEYEIESLFKAFMQTESGRRSGKGTGLGLSISQQLLELLGTKLQVQSMPNVGTAFWFDLSIEPATAPTPEANLTF
ncbi:CHASE2 domain-containing protein [Leptolyngbya sp. NIES-2104]|uniref:CHASE2 domain-containing protein n=1 Tax=Leptolyngbya sp. NIES-2104 TaxID=1552121 RepID=UPI0006ECAA3A|nr:CHASE2 domain-containing protein [Leptolyngbya sp. NIES-2104]GAP96210.1 adenylate cyclase [Leptolyngbya sp. NIES-2104]